MQKGKVESFNGRMRDEFLNVSWFRNIFDARRRAAAFRDDYNYNRPHSSLGYLTPAAFAQQGVTSPPLSLPAAALDRRQGNPSGVLYTALTPTSRRGSEPSKEAKPFTN